MEIKIRVRGEYSFTSTGLSPIAELPPRARRIQQTFMPAWENPGTTSACAENTERGSFIYKPEWNYLRVRGEYVGRLRRAMDDLELPPRARRIPPIKPRL